MEKKSSTGIAVPGSNGNGHGSTASTSGPGPGLTGRHIVVFKEGAASAGAQALEQRAGIRTVSARSSQARATDEADLVFDEIDAAVFSAAPDQHSALMSMAAESDSPILLIEPERVVYALSMSSDIMLTDTALTEDGKSKRGRRGPFDIDQSGVAPPPAEPSPVAAESPPRLSRDFLQGYRAAIDGLLNSSAARAPEVPLPAATPEAAGATYGLEITGVLASRFSGAGIKVAVLDTGLDLNHPDFAGRVIVTRSFVPGQAVQDGHGHGTHCIGTACGPRVPPILPRYGVAYGSSIFVGKVLSNQGSGADGGILDGINWAVGQGCHVISMSLGAPTRPGQPFSGAFEIAAQRAAQRGTIIVAAAGNDSGRPARIEPVSHPANCPSIVAVGALDVSLNIASFSNGGLEPNGGEVNVAGPGVAVYSTFPMPPRYRTLNGTSMATPHVAGILALYAEATGLRGFALVNAMLPRSRRLFPVRDFGWGLVQAI
jgi:subtilisin family serine protease